MSTPQLDSGGSVSRFHIPDMDCATEEQLIRNGLRGVAGISALDFDLLQRRLTVSHNLADPAPIASAIGRVGLRADLLGSEGESLDEHATAPRSSDRLVFGLSGLLALGSEVAAWTIGNEQSPIVIVMAVASIAIGGRTTLRKGWGALRTRTLNINLLMTIAVIGALIIGQWPEAAMVTFLFGLAEAIEGYALDRARNAIQALVALAPDEALVRQPDGSWQTVPARSVVVGAMVRVLPGGRVPLDGSVVTGSSAVNQAPITGESMPVDKGPGDSVFAGTINEQGMLEVTVTATAGETTLDRIIRAVQEAQAQRAPTQRFVDRFAAVYTPAVVILAILFAVLPPLFGDTPPREALYSALVLLVVACPCALVLSTPITVVSGLARAARRGILVKGGAYLEDARRIRVIALDKTGTLTLGKPAVTEVEPLDGGTPANALRLAASINVHSTHPVARAIVEAWKAVADGRELLEAADILSIPGRGVTATIGGKTYIVGNHRLAEEQGMCSPAIEAELVRLEKLGRTTVVLATAGQAIAVLGVSDEVRPTTAEAIASLHKAGIRTLMLTGDNEVTARAIAAPLGIDEVQANLLPEDKLAAIEALLARYGAIGMVGDGVNDAPALARSTVGFAMGTAGSDTAIETADVAILDDDLRRLPEFLELSRATGRILKQNITISIAVKAVFFILTFLGMTTLWMAVFADMGTSLIVVANGLRLLRGQSSHAASSAASVALPSAS